MRLPAFVCLPVYLYLSEIMCTITQKRVIDLDEMLRVDRFRDMDELIKFSVRSGLQSGCRNRIAFSDIVWATERRSDAWFQDGFIHREPWEQLFTNSSNNLLDEFTDGAVPISGGKLFQILTVL